MFTQEQLKKRGWSKGLREALLGPPDQTAPNPVFRSKAPVKLWDQSRVEKAEKHPKFIAHQHRRDGYSSSAKAVAERKRQELLDKVDAIDIDVRRWPLEKLYRAAILEWEQMGMERGDYERYGADADESTKNRWAVNYIRHNLGYSTQDVVLYRGQTGINEAKATLERKMYDAIAEAYPALADAAHNQAERLWGERLWSVASIAQAADVATLVISSVIIPEKQVSEGVLIRSTSEIWLEIVRLIGSDWTQAYHLPPERWEELIAGAFKKEKYDEVILTPRSGDHGRDVIAIRHGIGTVKILGSVKAYGPRHLVSYDDIRALYGVVAADRAASKGIIATTSDFPPRVGADPFIGPLIPTRLELLNGAQLQTWLLKLAKK
jgi:restriction system protein